MLNCYLNSTESLLSFSFCFELHEAFALHVIYCFVLQRGYQTIYYYDVKKKTRITTLNKLG